MTKQAKTQARKEFRIVAENVMQSMDWALEAFNAEHGTSVSWYGHSGFNRGREFYAYVTKAQSKKLLELVWEHNGGAYAELIAEG